MSKTKMTVSHAYSKCEEEYVNSALAMTLAFDSGGHDSHLQPEWAYT